MATLLVLLAISLNVYVTYRGYKYGKSRGHPWIGAVVGFLLFSFLLGPLFWALVSRIVKPAPGVGAA